MADTSSKTMDKKNVVWPPGGHAKLAMWAGIKGQLDKILLPFVDGDLGSIKTRDADELIKEAIAKKDAVKDTYFKIGLIGSDLVLRVKAKEKGIAQILGYDQQDALLLKKCELKKAGAAEPAKVTETIKFPTYIALSSGDCKPLLNEYLDVGDGFKITLEIKVEGVAENSGLKGRVTDEHKRFCEDYQKQAKAIADEAATTLSKLTVRSGRTLQEVADDANTKLKKLFDQATVAKEFEAAVLAMAQKDSNLKQHVKEWKIKAACTAVITTIKLATAFARLAASHGADVTAYGSIVTCGFSIYTLIKDFAKTEEAAAAELDKAIDLYKRSANDLLAEVEAAFKDNKLKSGTVLGTLGTLGDAASLAQDKITAKIKKLTGKDVAQEPESVRLRYLVELGKLLNALDKHFETMNKAMETFRESSINEAVKAWPKLQELKTACKEAIDYFRERETYAENAKAEIQALNIAVDDSTTLDKLKSFVAGVRGLDSSKVMAGAGGVLTVANTTRTAYTAVSGLVTAVKAFV